MERETGVEPATSTLARSRSTTELLPLDVPDYKQADSWRQFLLASGLPTVDQRTFDITIQWHATLPFSGREGLNSSVPVSRYASF